MFKFLRDDSNISSTRLSLFLGTSTACIILLAVFFHVIYCTVNQCAIEWSGAAMLITAVSAFMGTLLYGKVQQKKFEITNKPTTNDTIKK